MASDSYPTLLSTSTTTNPVMGSGSQKPNYCDVAQPPKPSYAALVSKPVVQRFHPIVLPPRQYGRKDGKPSVSFTAEEIKAGSKRFEHTLIAKFTVGRPPLKEIRHFLESNWSRQGQMTISDIWDGRHLIIMLDSEADVRIALTSPIRKIGHSLFRLFRWYSEYDFRRETTKRSVWIKLPGLPLQFYDKGFVKSIVSSFASFLDVDARTKACTNLNFARACVEIDVNDELTTEVWIQNPDGSGFWQSIEYEGNLQYCHYCKLHGHEVESCRKKQKVFVQEEVNQPAAEQGQVGTGSHTQPEPNPIQNIDSQWHVVPRRKKGKKGDQKGLSSSGKLLSNKEDSHGHVDPLGNKTQSVDPSPTHIGGVDPITHVSSMITSNIMDSSNDANAVDPNPTHIGCVEPITHLSPMLTSNKDAFNGATHVTIPMSSTKDRLEKAMGTTSLNNVSNDSDGLERSDGEGTMALNAVAHGDTRRGVPPMLLNHHHVSLNAMSPSTTYVTPRQETIDSSNVDSAMLANDTPNGSSALLIGHSNAAAKGGTSKPNSPTNQVTCSHDFIEPPNSSIAVSPCVILNGIVEEGSNQIVDNSCSTPVTQAGPRDSLDILRKKLGRRHEGSDFDHKIDSYGKFLFGYQENGFLKYINARGFYQRLKATEGDDANIFQTMDEIFVLLQGHAEASSSPIETEEDPFDLSRILKQPRQKAKGSRHSGRFGQKKKGSVYE